MENFASSSAPRGLAWAYLNGWGGLENIDQESIKTLIDVRHLQLQASNVVNINKKFANKRKRTDIRVSP